MRAAVNTLDTKNPYALNIYEDGSQGEQQQMFPQNYSAFTARNKRYEKVLKLTFFGRAEVTYD